MESDQIRPWVRVARRSVDGSDLLDFEVACTEASGAMWNADRIGPVVDAALSGVPIRSIEDAGVRILEHLADGAPDGAVIRLKRTQWRRTDHSSNAFHVQRSAERHVAEVTAEAVRSGVSWLGLAHADGTDVFAATVLASWTYLDVPDDYMSRWRATRRAITEHFAVVWPSVSAVDDQADVPGVLAQALVDSLLDADMCIADVSMGLLVSRELYSASGRSPAAPADES